MDEDLSEVALSSLKTGINKINNSKSYLRLVKVPLVSAKLFWAIAIVLHILGFWQALHTGSIYLVDSIDYLSQADNLLKHGSLYAAPWDGPFRFDYFTFRPPIYGLFILACHSVYASDYTLLWVQACISLSTFYGVLKLSRQLDFNLGRVRFFLILVLLFYPSQIIHCNFVMSDILFQSLLFWSFYFSYQLWVQPGYRSSILATLFFVLAMLTKPVAFLLGFTVLIVLAFVFYKKHSYKILLPFLLLPITYHSYCSYNKQITGYYHYSSVTPIFVLKYMAKYTNAQLYGENYADSVQELVMQRVNAEQEFSHRYQLMNQSGIDMIKPHKLFFAFFNLKGWLAFMLDPGRFEWVHFLNADEGSYLGLYHVIHTQGFIKGVFTFLKTAPLSMLGVLFFAFVWNLLVSIFLLLFLIHKKTPWALKCLVFLFVGYLIGSTGVLGLSRYRVAVAPLLWIAAMYVVHIWIVSKPNLNQKDETRD